MKKLIKSFIFLGVILALALSPTFTKNFSNEINNVDNVNFLLNEENLNEENQSKNTLKQVSLGSGHSAAITNDGKNDHLYT